MTDDAGDGIFLVGVHGTPVQAGRIHAVMASRGDGLLEGLVDASARNATDRAPCLVLVEPVQAVARRHARLAPGAGVESHGKPVLLAGTGRRRRHEVAVVARLHGSADLSWRWLNRSTALRSACTARPVVDRRVFDGRDGRKETHVRPTSTRPATRRTGKVDNDTDGSSMHAPVRKSKFCL